MAKLQRKSAKVFAEDAIAGIGGIAQFGSLAAGDKNYSKDIDVIQALDAYKEGWSSAVTGNKSPALEDRNALDYLLSYQQAYIMQHGVPEWLSTETYYENSYVVDSNGELRVSLIDNNTGHDPVLDDGGQQYWGYAGARGSGKQIGEIYLSQSSSAEDNKGALPLFTGELISNADNLYPQFYTWVSNHASLCTTQADYDSRISTYGECPFYVIDTTNKTIRLPKLVNYLKMANITDGVTQSNAGLPNLSGTVDVAGKDNTGKTGVFTDTTDATGYRVDGSDRGSFFNNRTIHFDASDANSIYGSSNTVTPKHTTLFPWVFAYNSAIAASTAQAAQFQAALTSKADSDLSNVLSTSGFRKLSEVYINGTSWYKVFDEYDPTTGNLVGKWCEQGGQASVGSSSVTFLKEFVDTNYYVTAHTITNDLYSTYHSVIGTKSTTGFTIASGQYNFAPGVLTYGDASWEAKGYIS